ncbi:MAG: hypothetical protein HOW73_48010 [Polyangiaceae bacterium]|nr:hypothetical protein [Polyangiaceae bacterium]
MRWTYALLFTTLLACDSSSTAPGSSSAATKSSGAPAASSAAATPKLCDKAEKLQKRIGDIDTKAVRITVGADIALPESKTGDPVSPMSPLVAIAPKDILVNGQSTKLAELKDKLQGRGPVVLAIPKGEEGIDRVADVIAAIDPETEIFLLSTLPGTKLEPQPKVLEGTKDPSERAVKVAETLKKSIGECDEANKIFQRLASTEPTGRAESLKKDLPVAVNACNCKIGDETEDLIAYLLAGEPPVLGKKIKLSKEKDAKVIKLKGLDGQKLYDALPADGSAVKLEK